MWRPGPRWAAWLPGGRGWAEPWATSRVTGTHRHITSSSKSGKAHGHRRACVCVCGHATGKQNMLRVHHVQGAVGPIGWKRGPNREGCRQHSLSPVAGQQGLLYYSLHCTHMHFFCKRNISHNSFYFLKKLWKGLPRRSSGWVSARPL